MQLSPPKRTTWIAATLLGAVAIATHAIVEVPLITPYAFWILAVAFILLFLATLLPGI